MKKAFTLIELIFVIFIISIITTVGTYKLGFVERYKVKKDIEILAENLKYTRKLAISKKTAANFEIYDDNSYTITCRDYFKSYKLNPKIKIIIKNKKINFTKYGSVSYGSAQTIEFKYNNKIYRISILPVTGRIDFKK